MSNNIIQKIFTPSARGKTRWIFIGIIILTIAAGLVDFGKKYNQGVDWLARKTDDIIILPKMKEIPFRLGLDLQGGSHLVYEADVSKISAKDRNNSVEGVRDVIERRINTFGVNEPIVQVNKTTTGNYRIIVELAGIQDVNKAIQMIGETPLLEFKESSDQKRELTEEEKQLMNDFNKKAETKAEEVLGKIISGGDFSALAKEYTEDKNTKEIGGDLGWITEKDNPEIINIIKNLNIGQTTTDLVQISNGYEIIKLEDKRVKTNPFSEQAEKQIKASHLLICYKDIDNCENNLNKEDAYEKIKKLKEQATPDNFVNLIKEHSTEPGAKTKAGDLGWFSRGMMVKPFEDVVFEQKVGTISFVVETQFGYHLIYKQDEKDITEYKARHIFIRTMSKQDILGMIQDWKNTALSGKYLKRASVQFNHNDGSPEVSLEFDDEGSKLFEEITTNNINKQVAIFLDGYIISAPTVNEKITGGKAVISGRFNIQEAKILAQRLNAGALPVPISLVSQKTIGASLGNESITRSIKAGIIGIAFIALFMILFYRIPGLLASFSLIVYGLLILAIFKIWPITLTLSGIAGFILSIGMAIDANILIFERLKEELRAGQSLLNAIDIAFRRAWPSIRDGNLSTLITCFILIQFSTSMIQGFAITLSIGILISIFSATIVTKNLLRISTKI